ncbi:PEP-CTERM protein-sorting domain-containing protein [Nitrosomonas aestuarii]|uniref:PEP-CTERM protein-sorting domain-containing protein n=1 Tax=Nitrosomonas aestuarii TaxID=52441 RepID=A0A1I4GFL6_9PROT|nr:hypothetical protein [Nitrosomonas aestuarii]SFL27961.1 PEP-CTERM protein-sorting domain-containing protein [Nitrosomonas aestuarii]
MKKILRIFLFCFVISATTQAFATISITLDQQSKLHAPGNVFIDIKISGLQSGGVNALLGAWELDFLYDPNVFQFVATPPAGLGALLGDESLGQAISLAQPVTTPGIFHVGVLSLLEADAATCVFCDPLNPDPLNPLLEDLQSDSFTLATVGLFAPTAGGAGIISSLLETKNIVLSDAFGNELLPVAHPSKLTNVVPIPATIALVGIGLFGWLTARRSRGLLPVSAY